MVYNSDVYIPRIADHYLKDALSRAGGVLIEGPKACGKTETAKQLAKSIVQVDTDVNLATRLEIMPESVLEGETPRLFDEWQVHPLIWNLVRHEIDKRKLTGQFILTGSTAASEHNMHHSGAGRLSRLQMQTMTFYETNDSDAQVSLFDLVKLKPDQSIQACESSLSITDIAQRIAIGGWPGNIGLSEEQVIKNNQDYLKTVSEIDISVPDEVKRDPQRVNALLMALSRSVASEVSISALSMDADIARDTVRDYLDALSRIYIVQNQPAWSLHLHSRSTLRDSPKRHLADPALCVAALHTSSQGLLNNLEYFGQVFETQVIHDLRAYIHDEVYHGRDAQGLEVDAIFTLEGREVFAEVKLGSSEKNLDTAATHLKAFASKYAKDKNPILIIITAGKFSYTRADGVHVVSFANLGR